jgi:hypothetical protein
MTSAAPVQTMMAKEARALLPIWTACVVAGAAAPFADDLTRALTANAFGFGMLALGAYSIGHEYVHRTLGVTLAQPVSRRQMFLVKLVVLAVMVLPLAAYASRLRLFTDAPELSPWIVAGGAVFLAPVLTMLCRNPLAGAFFSVMIAIVLLITTIIIRAGSLDPPPDVEREAVMMWARMMVVVSAVGLIGAWRVFMRLEWIESGVEFRLPSWAGMSRDIAPGRPFGRLIKKELRLHRVAFGVTALYVFVAVADAVIRLVRPHDLPFTAMITLGYSVCLPVLLGAVASAEERHLGTLSWHLLLPAPLWQQWAAKAGTVFGLALLLAAAMPILIVQPLGTADDRRVLESMTAGVFVVRVLLLSALGLYVSSLNRSGFIAVMLSFATIVGLMWFAGTVGQLLAPQLFQDPLGIAKTVGVATGLFVWFAFVNHRTEEPAGGQVWSQVCWLTALVAAAIVVSESGRF